MKQHSILMLIMAATMAVMPLENKAQVWSAENIPMAHLQDKNRYVSDPDGIMKDSIRHKADSVLRRLDKECGIESAFIIVNNVKDGDAFRMAQDVGNKYGVGSKNTNRGLVVVIAVKDRKYFIAPGEGLEDELSDAQCDQIAKEGIVRNMRLDNPSQAVFRTADLIFTKQKTGKTGEYLIDSAPTNSEETLYTIIGVLLFIVFPIMSFVGLYFYRKKHRKKYKYVSSGTFNSNSYRSVGTTRDNNSGSSYSSGSSSSSRSSSSSYSSSSSGSSSGGSYGGGSFGGGGAGGSW